MLESQTRPLTQRAVRARAPHARASFAPLLTRRILPSGMYVAIATLLIAYGVLIMPSPPEAAPTFYYPVTPRSNGPPAPVRGFALSPFIAASSTPTYPVLYLAYTGVGTTGASTNDVTVIRNSDNAVICSSPTFSYDSLGMNNNTHVWVKIPLSCAEIDPGVAYHIHIGNSSTVNALRDLPNVAGNYFEFWNTTPSPSSTPTKTQIVSIDTPILYSTTTSPVVINFTYNIANDSIASQVHGYEFSIKNSLTGYYVNYNGELPSLSVGQHSATTGSIALTQSGTYYVAPYLTDYSSTTPGLEPNIVDFYGSVSAGTYFGINFNDSIQTVHTTGIDQTIYSAVSCSISFSGTFNLPDCLGYLITPSTGSTSPMSALKSITLANSFPFAYLYQVPQLREALFNASSTASTTIGVDIPWFGHTTKRITFLSKDILASISIAALVKTILAWLLWLMLFELAWYKLLRSHDTTTL